MEYYQELVETEDGIPARIYYGGTGKDKLYYPLHWHRNLEFDLVLEGRIRGRVNGKEQSAGADEIFFVNSGELHETDGSSEQILRCVTLLLDERLLEEYCDELDHIRFVIEKGSTQEKRIAMLIQECARIWQKKEAYYELELAIRLRQICCILLRECAAVREQDARTKGQEHQRLKRIKRAISYMEENYEKNLSIQSMGDYLGMTPAYFSRFFKNSAGQNFHEYLERIRACRAREELESGDSSVTDISFTCGFPNVKSFINAFKKEYGTTPAQYRKKWNKTEKDKKRL